MLKGLTGKVTLVAIVFLAVIGLLAAVVLASIASVEEATELLNDEVVPQLDSKGDFITSMAHLLGEVEVFTLSHHPEDLTDAQQALQASHDAVTSLDLEAGDGDEGTDPEELAAIQRIRERATALQE